jgi:hypothetical protein
MPRAEEKFRVRNNMLPSDLRCRWTSLSLAISHDASDNQIWIVHSRTKCDAQGISSRHSERVVVALKTGLTLIRLLRGLSPERPD